MGATVLRPATKARPAARQISFHLLVVAANDGRRHRQQQSGDAIHIGISRASPQTHHLHGRQRNEPGKLVFEVDVPPAKPSEPPDAAREPQ
jgi:hypothetical protein